MHEYTVAAEIISILREKVRENERLVEVCIRKGRLRCLSDEALSQAFSILSADSPFQRTRLVFEEVPVTVCCAGCGYRGEVKELEVGHGFWVPVLACSACGGAAEVRGGNELEIARLTLDVPTASSG